MRDLLLFLLLAVVAYLAYDDYSKRNTLKAAQEEVQRLNADRAADRSQADQTPVRQRAVYVRPSAPAAASPPAWFQERLNERPSLDEPVRHRQSDQETSGRRSSTYGTPTPP